MQPCVYKSQEAEATQLPISTRMHKEVALSRWGIRQLCAQNLNHFVNQ